MPVPNLHNTHHVNNVRMLWTLLVSYRMPLFIFVGSFTLIIAFNLFMREVVHEVFPYKEKVESVRSLLRAHIPTCTAAHRVFARGLRWRVMVGNVLFFIMYVCLYRAVVTNPGYVRRDSCWKEAPECDAESVRRRRASHATQQAMSAETQALMYASLGIDTAAVVPAPPDRLVKTAATTTINNNNNKEDSSANGVSGVTRVGQPQRQPQQQKRGTSGCVVKQLEADGSARWCGVCEVFKPDGAYHCRYCGRCTRHMDHHCFYLNACVGLRNYKFFYLLVMYSTLCGLWCIPQFWWAWRQHYYDGCVDVAYLWELFDEHFVIEPQIYWLWVPVGMAVFSAFTCYLWVYHTRLLWRGQTTLRFLTAVRVERFIYDMRVRLYGRCAPQTSTLVWLIYCACRGCPDDGDSSAAEAENPTGAATAAEERGRRQEVCDHFRRVFGPRQGLHRLLLPIAPPRHQCSCCCFSDDDDDDELQ